MWIPSGTNPGPLSSRTLKPVSFCSSRREFCLRFLTVLRVEQHTQNCSLAREKAKYTNPWKSHSQGLSLPNAKCMRVKNLRLPRQFSGGLLLHNSEDLQLRNIFRLTRREQDSLNSSRIFLKRCFKNCTIILRCSRVESNKHWHEPSPHTQLGSSEQVWTTARGLSFPSDKRR